MQARFPGYCEECEDRIRVGDEIMPTEDGDWTHAKCVPPTRPARSWRGVRDVLDDRV